MVTAFVVLTIRKFKKKNDCCNSVMKPLFGLEFGKQRTSIVDLFEQINLHDFWSEKVLFPMDLESVYNKKCELTFFFCLAYACYGLALLLGKQLCTCYGSRFSILQVN